MSMAGMVKMAALAARTRAAAGSRRETVVAAEVPPAEGGRAAEAALGVDVAAEVAAFRVSLVDGEVDDGTR
jgi:hypothetical protein